jgi:hypothetical protein
MRVYGRHDENKNSFVINQKLNKIQLFILQKGHKLIGMSL